MRKVKGKFRKREPINIDEVRNELNALEEQIKEIETQNLCEKFLGVVFVVLDRPSDASRVINKQLNPITKYIIRILCCICDPCFPKGFWWSYTRAPEPSDIYW